jgi:hypothetical protein
VTAHEGMGIRDLAKQDPRGRHELLKGQGAAHEQARELQLAQHHPVEHARENHGQAAQASLEQAQAQQAGKGKIQLANQS